MEDIDARIEAVEESSAEYDVPYRWAVGLFAQPPDFGQHLASRGLSHADELPGTAADSHTLNDNMSFPATGSGAGGDAEMLRECIAVMRVGFELPELTSGVLFEVFTAVGLTDDSPLRSPVGPDVPE